MFLGLHGFQKQGRRHGVEHFADFAIVRREPGC
jgi:hypothetical protein